MSSTSTVTILSRTKNSKGACRHYLPCRLNERITDNCRIDSIICLSTGFTYLSHFTLRVTRTTLCPTMARRRRIGGLLAATAASLASVLSTHAAVVAAAGGCDIEIPAKITYANYNRLMRQRQDCEDKAAEAAEKQQAVLDDYVDQVLSGTCNGYVIPIIENIYVSLYGEAAVLEEWTDRVQAVFLDTMLDVLNECTDDCAIVDSLELELLELDTFSVDAVFGSGNGRYLADLGDELYMADDGETTLTSTYLLANAANGTVAVPAGEEGRQLQDRKRQKTSDRRKKSRGKRKVAKIRARGRNRSGSRRAGLLSKWAKTSDVIKGGGDGRRRLEEEADAGECGALLMERLADTGIDIFKCIANVELSSYNPVECIGGKLIDSTTDNAAQIQIGRSPQQTQGQSETIPAALVKDVDEEAEVPIKRRNRPRN